MQDDSAGVFPCEEETNSPNICEQWSLSCFNSIQNLASILLQLPSKLTEDKSSVFM